MSQHAADNHDWNKATTWVLTALSESLVTANLPRSRNHRSSDNSYNYRPMRKTAHAIWVRIGIRYNDAVCTWRPMHVPLNISIAYTRCVDPSNLGHNTCPHTWLHTRPTLCVSRMHTTRTNKNTYIYIQVAHVPRLIQQESWGGGGGAGGGERIGALEAYHLTSERRMKVWIVVNCPASKPFHAVAAWAFANFPKERQTLLTVTP